MSVTRPAGGKPRYRLRCGADFDIATAENRLRWWIEWDGLPPPYSALPSQTQEYWMPANAFAELKYRSAEAIRRAPR